MNSGILPETHISTVGFQCFIHENGLFRDDDWILGAMKYPDRRSTDGPRILFRQFRIMPTIRSVRPKHASADRHDGSKGMRPVLGDLPGAISAHRKASQIEALRVAVKLLHARRKSSHRHLHHVWIGPVMMLKWHLRHDDD